MTNTYDPHDPIGASKSPASFWWLRGRSGRREYWTSVALVFGIGLAMEYFPGGPELGSGLTVALMLLQVRRVHDFGRSGWWALAATIAPILVMAALLMIGLVAAALAGIALGLILIILIGVVPGNPVDNRFGPPPPFTAKRVLTGR